MANPEKAKGTAFESLIVRTLGAYFGGRFGLAPRRVAQEGYADTGDVHGLSPVILQAKAWKDTTAALREGVAGAVVQAQRAGEAFGVAVIKKPRGAAGEAYAAMRLQDLARLLLRLRRAETLLSEVAPSVYGAHLRDCDDDAGRDFPR